MMVEPGLMRVMEIMSETTNVIAEGEVLQLLNCHDADTTTERYMEVIHRKTAKLFEAATLLGPVLANKPNLEEGFAAYGRHLGAAFQLIDDALDYMADADELGKNLGDDLAEGKPTLPLIYILENGSEDEKALVRRAIETDGIALLQEVTDIIQNSGALAFTQSVAQSEADKAKAALNDLADSPLKTALLSLADLAVNRNH
jgi:octaprenyl-diphosphate synthase